MARKENKGGMLTNEQVEKDNQVKGKADEKTTGYVGMQDTGLDKIPPKQTTDNEQEERKG